MHSQYVHMQELLHQQRYHVVLHSLHVCVVLLLCMHPYTVPLRIHTTCTLR